MRKLIAAINMTLDGYCDHTHVTGDQELHQHYADLLASADVILYGRITYQLMEYWPTVVRTPTGNKSTDAFAVLMDNIHKIVFSRTLKTLDWKTATLATKDLELVVRELKKQPGKPVLAGSPSLIVALTQLGLIDEYQLCIHPVIAGSGLPLFKDISKKINLKLLRTKTLESGAVVHYYGPEKA